jgi:hypothetical protein
MDSKSDSSGRRIVDLLAVAMIGDGALALVVPTGHIKTWICGPQRWRESGHRVDSACRWR